MHKIIISFIFLVLVSVFFYACKNDSPVTSTTPIDKEKYYNWSVNTFTQARQYAISAGDAETLFLISGFRGYRFSNGVMTKLYFNDSSFTTARLNAFSGDYAVFAGGDALRTTFKIYDNGAYQSFTKDSVNYINSIYIEAKNKIYFSEANANRYFLYQNGSITTHVLPSLGRAFLFGRINDNVSVLGFDENSVVSVYTLTNGNASILYSEAANFIGEYFFIKNTLLKSVKSGNQTMFYYFNGTGFTFLFTASSIANVPATGTSINSLLNFCVDSTNIYKPYVWNGSENIAQTNFPLNVSYSLSGSPFISLSEPKNNSIFLVYYNNFDTLKIVKGSN